MPKKEPKTVHIWMPDRRSLCDRRPRQPAPNYADLGPGEFDAYIDEQLTARALCFEQRCPRLKPPSFLGSCTSTTGDCAQESPWTTILGRTAAPPFYAEACRLDLGQWWQHGPRPLAWKKLSPGFRGSRYART